MARSLRVSAVKFFRSWIRIAGARDAVLRCAMLADGIVEAFRLQAQYCAQFEAPLYAGLLARAADDIDNGGPTAAVLDGWQGVPMAAALPLRLLGAVHRMVLDGRAPALAPYYASVGGRGDAEAAWPVLRELIAAHRDVLRAAAGRQVQTNEVRRSAALLGGFLTIAATTGLPLRLLEIGASAGLNLGWDRYRYALADCDADTPPPSGSDFVHAWGDPAAAMTVRSGWHGSRAVFAGHAVVASRAGCDIAPLDLAAPDDVRTLESFVWPDHVERLAQLRAAIAALRADPPRLTRQPAGDWLAAQLGTPAPGVATVVVHSVMWWYLSNEERERVTALPHAAGARATSAAPLAWLRLDLFGSPRAELRLTTWPGGAEIVLGRGDAQGRWVSWLERDP